MRYLEPALIFVALTAAVSCAKRLPPPLAAPETPAPYVDTERQAALALLRGRLEVQSARRRVRLPADAHIRLTAAGARTYAFRCAFYAYVPAASWPWVYQAAGEVDLAARRVTLTALVAEPALGPAPAPPARPVERSEGPGMN